LNREKANGSACRAHQSLRNGPKVLAAPALRMPSYAPTNEPVPALAACFLPSAQEFFAMLDKPIVSEFSHVKLGDTKAVGDGLRDFFLYRDLGIAAATGGRVLAQIVTANSAPTTGTGWHQHVADFHIVLMLKGWAKFMYEDKETLVSAGDCVHQRPGITHYLFDYSPDMEYLEVVGPADFASVDVEGPCAVPAPQAWG